MNKAKVTLNYIVTGLSIKKGEKGEVRLFHVLNSFPAIPNVYDEIKLTQSNRN